MVGIVESSETPRVGLIQSREHMRMVTCFNLAAIELTLYMQFLIGEAHVLIKFDDRRIIMSGVITVRGASRAFGGRDVKTCNREIFFRNQAETLHAVSSWRCADTN